MSEIDFSQIDDNKDCNLSIPTNALIPLVNIFQMLQNKENMKFMISTLPLGCRWLLFICFLSFPPFDIVHIVVVIGFPLHQIKRRRSLTSDTPFLSRNFPNGDVYVFLFLQTYE